MIYNDDFSFPKSEPLKIDRLEFTEIAYPSRAILYYRRTELGLSTQQVADLSNITHSRYQSFESGERDLASASMRVGSSICHTLKLDPRRFVVLPASD